MTNTANPTNTIRQLEVGKVYSFDTYSPEVLGTRLINVECLAVMNAQTAISSGLDIKSFHERMKPHLPAGYNNNPFDMTYVKLVSVDGKETIYAMDWINRSTIQETSPNKITVTVNGVSNNDVEIIRKALTMQGYTDISIVLSER